MIIRNHLLVFFLVPLAIFLIGYTYLRFIVQADYMVRYEIPCDSSVHICYISCDDDACSVSENFAYMYKYAPDIHEECGPNITNCAKALECLPNDRHCSLIYCDPAKDGASCTNPIDKATTSSSTILEASSTVPVPSNATDSAQAI